MERILSMLISVLKVAALREEPSPLTVAPAADIWVAALDGLELEQADYESLVELSHAPSGQLGAATILATLSRVARTIGEQLQAQPQLARQIDERHDALAAILSIHTLASGEATDRLDLRFESLALFDYIEQLYITAADGEPGTILVGTRPGRETSVTFKGPSYIEQRTTIIYRHDQRYPRLNVRTPTQSGDDEHPHERPYWIQKASPAYDLEVYTHQERRMGLIRTHLEPLSKIAGWWLSLTFAPQRDAQLLATDVLDTERIRIQCLQVISSPGQVA